MIGEDLRFMEEWLAFAAGRPEGLSPQMCRRLLRALRPAIDDVENLERRVVLEAGPRLLASGFLAGPAPELAGENVVPFRRPGA